MRRFYLKTPFMSVPGTPNLWDVLGLLLVFVVFFGCARLASQMSLPYAIGEPIPISLSVWALPGYALRTVGRMAIAMIFSLLFTFIFGTLAAKSRYAERLVIPLVDILQSVPPLGFLSITIMGFILLFPNSLLGPEFASIFVIFTSQAWNMLLAFYQSLRTVPEDLIEAADMFHLNAWQRFWRIEVPFAVPSLLWNAMMSMSGGWFFVVASEAISVSNQQISLPGIGSYIDLAIQQANTHAVIAAIVTMFVVIILYDQLLFRPLVCWSEKFKLIQDTPQETAQSWLIQLGQKTRLLKFVGGFLGTIGNFMINFGCGHSKPKMRQDVSASVVKYADFTWNIVLVCLLAWGTSHIFSLIHKSLDFSAIREVFFLGLLTGIRVFALIFICSLILIPLGVRIGMSAKLTRIAQPIIQILAAFPANLLYPVVVLFIVRYKLNVEIWTAPLMVLGAQWYILFNVIAGASSLPKDLYQATSNLGVKGWLWWRKFILPGIFPFYITGAITAAGGAWNASIIAECVTWGDTTLRATGLGAYIENVTKLGHFPEIALGISVMCIYVLILNRIIWRPLYQLAEKRCKLG